MTKNAAQRTRLPSRLGFVLLTIMRATSIASIAAGIAIVGGFGYAWWYDAHPRLPHHTAAATTPSPARDAQPPAPPGIRSRVEIGTTVFDITALGPGDAARELCEAATKVQLEPHVGAITPRLVRGCDAAALPVLHHDPGFVIRRHHDFDEVDAMFAGSHTTPGATATIEEVDVFDSEAHCEEVRKRLADHAQAAGRDATASVNAALAHEMEAVKDDPEKLAILQRVAGSNHAAPPAETIPPCHAE